MGITRDRYDFLGKRLREGMSRAEAARALIKSKFGKKKDGTQLSDGTATTMVYQMFSGDQYAVIRPKKKTAPKAKAASAKKKAPVKASTKAKTKPTAAKPKVSSKKAVAKKPVPGKPAVKKTPTEDTSFRQKAEDEVRESVKAKPKTSTKKKATSKKSSTKEASTKKKTSTPKSRKKKVEEGAELVF